MLETQALLQSRMLGLALNHYSKDHGGKYPEGQSSTQIFQQLLDEKYITDPGSFYFPLYGKVKSKTSFLKPENVSWDVSCCIDAASSDDLPVVFITGYKIVYQAGARAIPLSPKLSPHTWSNWWSTVSTPIHFTAVCYKNLNAQVLHNSFTDGSLPNFISVDFDSKGKVYRQLTPDGEIPDLK